MTKNKNCFAIVSNATVGIDRTERRSIFCLFLFCQLGDKNRTYAYMSPLSSVCMKLFSVESLFNKYQKKVYPDD